MQPFLSEFAGNASGVHGMARTLKTALEAARERIADVLACSAHDIVFTSGGTEADNLAVKGAAWAAADRDARLDGVVCSAIEHKAVLAPVERLGKSGMRATVVGVGADGVIDLDRLADALDDRTAVVSVMLVNNETGVVQPLDAVAELVAQCAPNAVLHTDAVQAPQWLDLAAATAPAALVSLSAHKFGGPKGTGVLVRRGSVPLVPLVEGGGHERGVRAGTHDVAGAVGFATALDETVRTRADDIARIAAARDAFEAQVIESCDGVQRNGDAQLRVAGFSNLAFDGIDAEALLVALDIAGVCASAGSACSSGATEPSHVLRAMGVGESRARSSIRCTFGWNSTIDDAHRAATIVVECVRQLRVRAA